MGFLYDITLQTNQLTGDKWSFTASASGGGGSISVTGAGSLCSDCNDYGASVVTANAGSSGYGRKTQADTTRHYRLRFYLDPNTLTMAGADSFTCCRIASSFGGNVVADVYLQYDGANYEFDGAVYDDAAAATGFTATDITDAPHWVEVYVLRAETNVSSDGELTWWIDGTEIESVTGLDNYDLFLGMTETQLGAVAGVDAGTSGTFYVDELEANDDGGPIGPCGPCPRLKSYDRCTIRDVEHDRIRVPADAGGGTYDDLALFELFGLNSNRMPSYENFGLPPLHFLTQRGPFQDGETVLDMRFDTRTIQILIEETLASRWQFWDRRNYIIDYLRPNRAFGESSVLPLIYQKWLPAGKLQRFVDMETTAGSATVTSHDGRFVHWGVQAGDQINITSGLNTGAYTVSQVVNDFTLELDANLVADETGVHYEYRRGHGIRELNCMLENGPTFDEGTRAMPITTGYSEALRFVAHDPMWYGEEQSQAWGIAGALGDLVFDGAGAWCGATPGTGRWLFAPTFVGETVRVTYWGTKEAKPVITIAGPAENPVVENTTVGSRIEMDYTVAVGETVTIDTLNLTITSSLGTNLLPYTTGDLALFGLVSAPQAPNRNNDVYVSFSSGDSAFSEATMTWRNRYVGI